LKTLWDELEALHPIKDFMCSMKVNSVALLMMMPKFFSTLLDNLGSLHKVADLDMVIACNNERSYSKLGYTVEQCYTKHGFPCDYKPNNFASINNTIYDDDNLNSTAPAIYGWFTNIKSASFN
jgi:hypothetical protein